MVVTIRTQRIAFVRGAPVVLVEGMGVPRLARRALALGALIAEGLDLQELVSVDLVHDQAIGEQEREVVYTSLRNCHPSTHGEG